MVKQAHKADLERFYMIGEERFYRTILSDALPKIVKIRDGEYKGSSPEIDLLNTSDKFLQLARRGEEGAFLDLSRLYRKAAHRIYRVMLQMNMTNKNQRFLNVV